MKLGEPVFIPDLGSSFWCEVCNLDYDSDAISQRMWVDLGDDETTEMLCDPHHPPTRDRP
jgi:hypothetical protein